MGLETGTYISDLNASNPVGASDPKSQGDDHIRLIKSTLLATFPNISGAMTATHSDLNILAGAVVANRVTLPVGDAFRIQDGTGADYIDISHDGTDLNAAFAGTTAFKLRDGVELRVYDSSDADYIGIAHDGTDVNISFAGTTAINVIGLTTFKLRDGAALQILDSTDADSMTVSHDGTDLNAAFAGTTAFKLRDGVELRVYDSADTDYTIIKNDGTNAIIDTGGSSGALNIRLAGTTNIALQTYNGTGNTSSAQLRDHGNTLRDIGFNDLPVFNDDTADTLEAQHAGSLQVKDGTSAITLTLEASTSTDFPVGCATQLLNLGASGNYTVNEGTGTTLYYVEPGAGITDTAGGCTVGPGGVVTIYRRSTTVYYIWGSEITA